MVETGVAPTVKDMVEASGRKQIINLVEFQRNLTTWVTVSRQAFTAVQEPVFCEMIANLNKTAAQMLPSSNTVRSWVVNEFNRQKKYLVERLSLARSRVHLSFDHWTAPAGNRSYLGIVAHWVDHANFDIGNSLIALPALEDCHTGENITNCLVNVVQDYGFGHKVGYCMGDSASNNRTAAIELQLLLTSKFGATAGVIQPFERQLCCFGHQLNLGAKKLLFGHDVEAIETRSTNFTDEKADEEEFKHWRKVGPVGKVHNFEVFIRRSDQRQQAFREVQLVLKMHHTILITAACATRWNAWFLMINDALTLRYAIEMYISVSLASDMFAKDKKKLEAC